MRGVRKRAEIGTIEGDEELCRKTWQEHRRSRQCVHLAIAAVLLTDFGIAGSRDKRLTFVRRTHYYGLLNYATHLGIVVFTNNVS